MGGVSSFNGKRFFELITSTMWFGFLEQYPIEQDIANQVVLILFFVIILVRLWRVESNKFLKYTVSNVMRSSLIQIYPNEALFQASPSGNNEFLLRVSKWNNLFRLYIFFSRKMPRLKLFSHVIKIIVFNSLKFSFAD